MGLIAAGTVVDRVHSTLFDATGERWSESDILEYLSDAQRQIVVLRPEANACRHVLALAAGTEQTLPADSYKLLDVVRNMGADPHTAPGRSVRMCSRVSLDSCDPDWHQAPAAQEVQSYTYDTKDPNRFFVYPPQPGTGRGALDIAYAKVPAELPSRTAVIEVSDVYAPNLYHYAMYRALTKDQPGEEANAAAAENSFRLFAVSFAAENAIDALLYPNQQERRRDN